VSSVAYLAALIGVGVLAGIVSTVASLASVVSYPALLAPPRGLRLFIGACGVAVAIRLGVNVYR
jgi:hypothetical protein